MRKLVLLTTLAAAGCAQPGDRARAGCPAGESCSPKTPDGLFFLGAQLGDAILGRGAPLITAFHGTQTITIVTGIGNGSPVFTMPYTVAASNSSLSLHAPLGPNVQVEGSAEGTGYLRILDPATSLLFDRVAIDVRAIDHSAIRPADYMNPAADQGFAADVTLPWALYAAPQGEPVEVLLFASDGQRMADESMNIGLAGAGVTSFTSTSWDTIAVNTVSGTSVTVQVTTGDGVVRDGNVRVAASVADVIWVPAVGAGAAPTVHIPLATPRTFCFRALDGGDLLAGVTWTFTSSTLILRTALAGKNCATVQSATAQGATLTANASGTMKVFNLTFSPTKQKVSETGAPEVVEAGPGERAAGGPEIVE